MKASGKFRKQYFEVKGKQINQQPTTNIIKSMARRGTIPENVENKMSKRILKLIIN